MDLEIHRQFVDKLLSSRKAEALAWPKGSSAKSFHNIGELATTEESLAFVQSIYSLGARAVAAVKIMTYDQDENTGDLLVELLRDRFLRSELFAFQKKHAESKGFDGTEDNGQLYLYFKLD
jgi:hypothetical protein